jgi:hypothetical protein
MTQVMPSMSEEPSELLHCEESSTNDEYFVSLPNYVPPSPTYEPKSPEYSPTSPTYWPTHSPEYQPSIPSEIAFNNFEEELRKNCSNDNCNNCQQCDQKIICSMANDVLELISREADHRALIPCEDFREECSNNNCNNCQRCDMKNMFSSMAKDCNTIDLEKGKRYRSEEPDEDNYLADTSKKQKTDE